MRRLALTLAITAAVVALAVPAAASAVPIDRYRGTDGVGFALDALEELSGRLAQFSFVADPPDGDTGPYSADPVIETPGIGLARKGRSVLAGTAIGCGRPAATAVFGTVRAKARIVRATTVTGRTFRLRKVAAPAGWGFRGKVVGRVLGGEQSVKRVEAFAEDGGRLGAARFAAPLSCPR